GSGKTTVARALAAAHGLEHIELDSLWWEAGWRHVDGPELRRRLSARLAVADRWVIDGNYVDEVAALVWPAADLLLWLDVDRRVGVRRATTRAFRRLTGRQVLWGGNRETPGNLSPRNLWRLWNRWPDYSRRIDEELRRRPLAARVVRCRTRREVDAFLAAAPEG
ncbi:MAG TPA: hypothetical protein VHN98_11230, partial [Acidimicrobiales bacterium]|nr:hypothetical protein [Acidimicrobiales bacterium]